MNTMKPTDLDLAAMHEAAGERYGAAVHELQEAYVEMLGVGTAAANRIVSAISENDRIVPSAPLQAPVHPKFLPSPINNSALNQRASQRAAELLAGLGIN